MKFKTIILALSLIVISFLVVCNITDITYIPHDGDFAPYELGNTWRYEGEYHYGHVGHFQTIDSVITKTITVISNVEQGETTRVIISVTDTGYTYVWEGKIDSSQEPPVTIPVSKTVAIDRKYFDTCYFHQGILMTDSVNRTWHRLPFYTNKSIPMNSLHPLLNGEPGYYYYDGKEQGGNGSYYIQGIGLYCYKYTFNTNQSWDYSLFLTEFNSRQISTGERIAIGIRSKWLLFDGDTIFLERTPYENRVGFKCLKVSKVGSRLESLSPQWIYNAGNLPTIHIDSSYSSYSIVFDSISAITDIRSGFITAVPENTTFEPILIYIVYDPVKAVVNQPSLSFMLRPAQPTGLFNLLGRAVRVGPGATRNSLPTRTARQVLVGRQLRIMNLNGNCLRN